MKRISEYKTAPIAQKIINDFTTKIKRKGTAIKNFTSIKYKAKNIINNIEKVDNKDLKISSPVLI